MLIIATLNLPYTAVFETEKSAGEPATAGFSRKPSLVDVKDASTLPKGEVPFDFEPAKTKAVFPEDVNQMLRTAHDPMLIDSESTTHRKLPVQTPKPDAATNILMSQLEGVSFQTGLRGVSAGDYDVEVESERLGFTASSDKTKQAKRTRILRRMSSSMGDKDPEFAIAENAKANRGLINALESAYNRKLIEKSKYCGLVGLDTDRFSESLKDDIALKMLEKDCHAAFVSDKDRHGHYNEYCKNFLWPTFHCEIPDIPSSRHYEGYSWDSYVAVNQAIADQIVASYKPGDTVWVHDYHLMLVPQMVREKLPLAPIGFFMHVAFPSSEVFRCLAYRAELLNGVLEANLVGFHIPEYAHHFKMALARVLAVDITGPGCVETESHNTFILAYPMGVDTSRLDKIIDVCNPQSRVQEHRRVIRRRWPTQHIIAARDKLDPIRGLPQKLRAFDQFLSENPEWAAKVVLVQICSGASADGTVETLVDRINSKYGDIAGGVMPVVLLKQDVKYEQYLALLSEASGFCVSCLRDGMNLTCHEFVQCQGPDRMGALILSEFTGSASVFKEGALMINPWNQNQLAQAFKQCLTMPKNEREKRWKLLRARVADNQSYTWARELSERITLSWQDEVRLQCALPDIALLQHMYHAPGGQRLFFLELERPESESARQVAERLTGRSVTSELHPAMRGNTPRKSESVITPVPVSASGPYFSTRLSILSELLTDKRNTVYVVSAESMKHMETMYRSVPGLGLIAELGKFVKLAGGSDSWFSLPDMRDPKEWHAAMQPWVDMLEDRSLVAELHRSESMISVKFNVSDDPALKHRDLATIGEYLSLINDHFARALGVRTKHEGDTVTLYRSDIGAFREHAYSFALEHIKTEIDMLFIASQHLSPEADDSLFEWSEQQVGKRVKSIVKVLLGGVCSKAQYKVEGANALLSLIRQVQTREMPREVSSRTVSRRSHRPEIH